MDKKEVTKGLSKARKHYKKYERVRINRTVRRKGLFPDGLSWDKFSEKDLYQEPSEGDCGSCPGSDCTTGCPLMGE